MIDGLVDGQSELFIIAAAATQDLRFPRVAFVILAITRVIK